MNVPKIIPKHRQHLVRQHIPVAVQAILGRKMFRAYLPTRDPHEAYILAKPILLEWEARIVEASQAKQDGAQTEIMRLRLAYEHYRNQPLDQAGRDLFKDILDFLFQHLGGVTPAVQRLVLMHAKGNVEQALKGVERASQANEAARQIVALRRPRHPFLKDVDEYERTADIRNPRTRHARAAAIRRFAYAMVDNDESKMDSFAWEDISAEKTQTWLDVRIKSEAKVTTTQQLMAVQSYWNWAASKGKGGLKLTQQKTGPFYEVRVGYRKREEPVPRVTKLAFTPQQVVQLHHEAKRGIHYMQYMRRGEPYKASLSLATCTTISQRRRANALIHCMVIKAYTSIRLGAIGNIEIDHVEVDEETGIRYIYVLEDKSEAGKRMIPIHRELEPLIDMLIADAKQAGRKYLIDTKRDQFGHPGYEVSTGFSALKTAMGYSKEYSEHCIRKTIEAMWEKARIPLKTRKLLIGHTIKDITEGVGYGKYGSPVPLPELKEAIDVIEYPGPFELV